MARQLTKHDQNGSRYLRPRPVEQAIDEALAQGLPALRNRAQIRVAGAPGFLPSECLVHLIREARRRNDNDALNVFLPVLLERAKANLQASLRDHRGWSAEDLREEVLGQFAELFASDGTGDNPNELDYFEVRFNQAFAALRTDLFRSEMSRVRVRIGEERVQRRVALPLGEDREALPDDEALGRLPDDAGISPSTQESDLFRLETWAAIDALPPDEREAVILVYRLGYKEESEDPLERTAASICGVTGRTIRNRLRRALAKLEGLKENV